MGLSLEQWSNQDRLKSDRSWLLPAIVLVLLIVGSAQTVVYSSFKGRGLIHQLHQLEQERNALQIEWGQLLLEQSAWVSHGRVEAMVREKLRMQVPVTRQIIMVQP